MKPTLLVMAAGLGSRYGSMKQMDPIGLQGETIIDYSIYDAIRAGFGKIVFVIRPEMEFDFRENILSKFSNRIPVEYVFQEANKFPENTAVPSGRNKPWGTAHAVLMAAEIIHEPFAVINSDDFYGVDPYMQMVSYLTSLNAANQLSDEYAMIGYPLCNTLSENGAVSRGVCEVDRDFFLKEISERTGIESVDGDTICRDEQMQSSFLSKNATVSMNFWGFRPSIFPKLSIKFTEFMQHYHDQPDAEFYIPSVVDKLIKAGEIKVKVFRSSAQWFGLTYKTDKILAAQRIKQLTESKIYPPQLWT